VSVQLFLSRAKTCLLWRNSVAYWVTIVLAAGLVKV